MFQYKKEFSFAFQYKVTFEFPAILPLVPMMQLISWTPLFIQQHRTNLTPVIVK